MYQQINETRIIKNKVKILSKEAEETCKKYFDYLDSLNLNNRPKSKKVEEDLLEMIKEIENILKINTTKEVLRYTLRCCMNKLKNAIK